MMSYMLCRGSVSLDLPMVQTLSAMQRPKKEQWHDYMPPMMYASTRPPVMELFLTPANTT